MKIKKSKVIIPALGILLLSTAASVSGTVAWFTANTKFQTNISNFAVANLEGKLDCAFAGGAGTTAAGDSKSVSVNSNVAMGDASFNHTTKKLYTDVPNTTNFKLVGTDGDYADANADWRASTSASKEYWYGVTWTMTFSYEFKGDATNMLLYFDADTAISRITATSTQAADTAHSGQQTKTGFRIAFMATKTVVWAPEQNAANCKYVSNTTTAISYSSGLVAKDTSSGLATSTDPTGADTSTNYLGTFTGAVDSTVNLVVDCAAWFEGTDPNIVTGAEMDSIAAALGFFVLPTA